MLMVAKAGKFALVHLICSYIALGCKEGNDMCKGSNQTRQNTYHS